MMDTTNSDSNALTHLRYAFCSKCGESNKADAAFCSSCGQSLQPTAGERSQVLTNSIPELEAMLEVLEAGDGDANKEQLIQTRFTLAVAYLRKEETTKAIAQLRTITSLDDTNPMAHAYLGAALLEEYHVEEAKDELEYALELDPNDAIIHLKMGEFNLKLGLVVPAQTHLEAAFKLPAPSPETAHYIHALLQKVRKMNKKIVDRPNRTVSLKIPNLTKWLGSKRSGK